VVTCTGSPGREAAPANPCPILPPGGKLTISYQVKVGRASRSALLRIASMRRPATLRSQVSPCSAPLRYVIGPLPCAGVSRHATADCQPVSASSDISAGTTRPESDTGSRPIHPYLASCGNQCQLVEFTYVLISCAAADASLPCRQFVN